MKSLVALFALVAIAMLAFPAVTHAGGHGVAVQAFAVPQCHAQVQAFAVPSYHVQSFAVQAAPVVVQQHHHGVAVQNFAVKSFAVRQQAAFVPQVNVQVNQQRRGFFSRVFGRNRTNVRVQVR